VGRIIEREGQVNRSRTFGRTALWAQDVWALAYERAKTLA